ncbi:MAG TPA: aminoglycoside phosphotransferase family protein [Bacillales bacterium]|nr:aminoglycoside phosphotransferase family protein [Bacillales bacterium]
MSSLASSAHYWVRMHAGADSEIHKIEPLAGATSSELYELEVRVAEKTKKFVLRLFTNKEWLAEEPDLALHEAESLKQAGKLSIPVPKLIAYDKNGSQCGEPAVMMTKVDGNVELQPATLDNWLDQMAITLSKVHSLDTEAFSWHYFSYTDLSTVDVPKWSSRPDLWDRAIHIVKGPKPQIRECFIHRDFHPANVLWQDGQVSGVVDWTSTCLGPVWVDVGHCRANLAMLHGPWAADRFLHTYQSVTEDRFHYELYWDLLAFFDFILPGPPQVYEGWPAFGVHHLSNRRMRERADQYLNQLINRGETHGHSSV